MKYYNSVLWNFNVLQYGGANTKAEDKCDVGYVHSTYEVDQGPTLFPGKLRIPLVLLTGPEVLNEANCRIAPPNVSSDNWSIYKSLLLELLTAWLPL